MTIGSVEETKEEFLSGLTDEIEHLQHLKRRAFLHNCKWIYNAIRLLEMIIYCEIGRGIHKENTKAN